MCNDKVIDEDEDVKISVENDVATLLVANTNANKHYGHYTCHMNTSMGEATCSIGCNVKTA